MSKAILILGAGQMQIPAIITAKSKDWIVWLADGNSNAVGIQYADHFLHIDLKDKHKLAESASRIKKKHGLDGVFTAGTDFSTTVAYIAEQNNLSGISYEAAINATDKSRMRSK